MAEPVWKIATGLISVSIILTMFYCGTSKSVQESTAPSDEKIIAVFQAHRSELDRLREMATEDAHKSSIFSETNISDELTPSRQYEYRKLLKELPGLQIGTSYEGGVRFLFAETSQAIGPGWAKGIEFVSDMGKVVGTTKDSLDETRQFPAGVYLRRIDSRWFVFFQSDD